MASIVNYRRTSSTDKVCRPILFCFLVFVAGCATAPSVQVRRPWVRCLESNEIIDPTKTVKIDVSGATSPLLGSELLTSEKLRSRLTELLKRRGFIVDGDKDDYLVKLSYGTDRHDKMRFSSGVSSTNYQAYWVSAGAGAGAKDGPKYGLGVGIAEAIAASASKSSLVVSQTADQVPSYTHTISMEISNKGGTVLWKGESTWDSQELNLFNGAIPAFQLILSHLPSDNPALPEIAEVKGTHGKNYYALHCWDRWFTCPALPYRIQFCYPDRNSLSIYLPRGLSNQNALAAYVDLIQTAEYALPDGDENDWKDPLDSSLWKKETLGGQYLLGTKKTPANIIIELKGRSDGYYIESCKIATEKEFSEFSKKLAKWRATLSDYYDVYQR